MQLPSLIPVLGLLVSCLLIACGDAPPPFDYPIDRAAGDAGSIRPIASSIGSPAPQLIPTPPPPPPPTPTPTPAPTTEPKLEAGPPEVAPVLIPMHMQYASNGDWLMSQTAGEGAPAYTYTGVQFKVLESPPTTGGQLITAFFRCVNAIGTHFQSMAANCEGAGKSDGLLGYLYLTPRADTVPVYRCVAPSGRPIVTTAHSVDCTTPGWSVQGVIGYAVP